MRQSSLFSVASLGFLLVGCCAAQTIATSTDPRPAGELKNGRRGPRFLGLLGLLTGLTLVDSLDDSESDHPRRSGFVKIDVGRPSALDGFYGAYGYTSPYWHGGSSINIKIPFRPSGGEFETMALFPFPVPFPPNGPAHFGPTNPAIEPRPTIFSDPVPGAANGSGAILADEEPSLRKQKLTSKRIKSGNQKRQKVSPPRTIRSTVRADDGDGANDAGAVEVPETTDTSPAQDAPETVEPTSVSNDPDVPTTHPSIDQAATPASIVQTELNYVTQPTSEKPSSYSKHPNSLADVSAIQLTTSYPSNDEPFQPSRADHWRDYYSSVTYDSNRLHGFFPIALPTK